jgi:flagellar basal body-associated protein FliL
MFVVGALALSSAGNEGMRPLLLALLLIAVVLILAGSVIALLTLRSQRKEHVARIAVEPSNNEKE